MDKLEKEIEKLRIEKQVIQEKEKAAFEYIRNKIDQLLVLMGTVPLKPEELDNETLIDLDPIGIIAESFSQVLDNLHQTNDNLKTAKQELRAIFNSIGGGILVLDADLDILTYNKKMEELFHGNSENNIGEHCSNVLCDHNKSNDGCLLKELFINKKVTRQHNWICRGRHYDVIGTPILDEQEEVKQIVMLYMDITQRKEVEQALRESEEQYRDLFENAHDIIQILKPDGRFLYTNKAWRDTFGYNEAEIPSLNLFKLINPAVREHCEQTFQRVLLERRVENISTSFVSKDGRNVHLEGSATCRMRGGKVESVRCMFRDVTEKKRMEEDLLRALKLESVGILAGGIAHDFNNLLTAVLGNVSLVKMDIDRQSDLYDRLSEVEKATLQAKNLTRQLLTFSKGGAPIKKTASLPEIIQESVSFILRGSSVKCKYSIAEDLHPVEADEGQLSQVIQNLVLNATQAMPAGGEIDISAENKYLGKNEVGLLREGHYIMIAVKDRGLGIPQEYLSRIFDPYFTTKHKGSGLGLATAYSIIKNHNGLMTVESDLGSGTVFYIYLPISEKKLDVIPAQETAIARGQGRILIMDDEEIVRDVVRTMLESLGYETAESEDGQAALDVYGAAKNNGKPFDAVIMDLTVPGGMGGKEAVGKMLEMDATARIIVSSGYANDPIMANYQEYGFCGVIPKPFKIDDLSRVLSTALKSAREQ